MPPARIRDSVKLTSPTQLTAVVEPRRPFRDATPDNLATLFPWIL